MYNIKGVVYLKFSNILNNSKIKNKYGDTRILSVEWYMIIKEAWNVMTTTVIIKIQIVICYLIISLKIVS